MLLGVLLLSNLSYQWSILFVLSFAKRGEKHMISSFARLKTVILFSSFLQLICFASSFVDEGPLGGACSIEETGVLIPYLFDIMYGL